MYEKLVGKEMSEQTTQDLNDKKDLDRLNNLKDQVGRMKLYLILFLLPVLYQDGYWWYSAITQGWLGNGALEIALIGHAAAIVLGLLIIDKFRRVSIE